MTRNIKIPYGSHEICFDIPSENVIIGAPKEISSCNLRKSIKKALDNPYGCKPLEEMVEKGQKVTIITDDYTRLTPAAEILPFILERLNKAGIQNNDISIVVAAGIHREMNKKELENKLGKQVFQKIKIIKHNADDKNNLTYLGKSSRGTPIWLNKDVVNADFKIGIGLVEAHPYAGFCGGPKIMMPGVAGKETIFPHHGTLAESADSWFGKTEGNPFWEDIVEIAKIGGLNSIVDVVINGRGEVVDVFFGEAVLVQKAAIKTFTNIYGVGISEPVDIVIASGNPKYWYFDQSNVSMLSAGTVIKKGGTRIIAAYCPEGLGPDIIRKLYLESFGRSWPTPEQYLQEIKQGLYDYEMADAPAIYKLLQAEKKAHMILVTEGINTEDANKMRLDWTRNIQEAVDSAFSKYDNQASVLILPLGSMSYTYIK